MNFQDHYSSLPHEPSEIILICCFGAQNISYFYHVDE